MDIDDQPDIFPDGAGPSSGLPRPSPSPSAGDKGGRRNLLRVLPKGRKGGKWNNATEITTPFYLSPTALLCDE